MNHTAILLIAHGSPVASANEDLHHLAGQVRERGSFDIVEPAFLERARPSIPEGIDACVARGAERVVVVPFFLFSGSHVVEDIPRFVEEARVRYPQVAFVLGGHLGEQEGLADVLLDRIRETDPFFEKRD